MENGFYADLHIHSRFSRATSRECNLEQLAFWAGKKGLAVIGTGDFTHPAWRHEIKTKLTPAEPGLFRLRADLEQTLEQRQRAGMPAGHPGVGAGPARFLLQVEISTIYKQGDRTRKVHHLIYAPDIQSAEAIVQRLARIGNLEADGRPILGLNSRDLLELTLAAGADCFLIPAHIWTPWFSALGSKSGFDSIAECYGDLAGQVFAVETGLSSDPLMNWRVSQLDRYRLISNSDAHSPANLGREACVFNTPLDYFAMRRALATGAGFGGTVEFFPEEGKYHLDGHRKCGLRFAPEETKRHHGLCPVCGKEVTVGVLYRVAELADRPAGTRLTGAAPFRSLVPLTEILSEIVGTGPDSQKVQAAYAAMIAALGPELFILDQAPLDEIRRVASPLLAEAITRLRRGQVIREAGYDGEYGTIRLFKESELKGESEGGLLFDLAGMTTPLSRPAIPAARSETPASPSCARPALETGAISSGVIRESRPLACPSEQNGLLDGLDSDQRRAVELTDQSLLIIAGPGTGKTRVLTHRIAHLVADQGIPPEHCLAITFTRRAAGEMQARLDRLAPDQARRIPVFTFHALAHSMLREYGDRLGLTPSFRIARPDECARLLMETLAIPERKAKSMLADLSRIRRQGCPPGAASDQLQALERYRAALRSRALLDFDDLIGLTLKLLDHHPDLAAHYRKRYPWIAVDEYQDIDGQQYRLVKQLVLPSGNICAIGDPDQAIYGFRGTDVRFFQRFTEDYPHARTVRLTRNYRSGRTIVSAFLQVIAPSSLVADRTLHAQVDDPARITIHEALTDRAEAEFIVQAIERLMGGTTFFSKDSRRVQAGDGGEALAFSDFGVLYRTEAQADTLGEAFDRSGMPFQRRSHQSLLETPGVLPLVEALRNMPEGLPGERLDAIAAQLGAEASRPETQRVIQALRVLAGRCPSLEIFLSELALGADVDLWDPRAQCVSLLTLHAAKGLEFPVVFIAGCEDGILPLRWAAGDDRCVEEERRLFFVGMSRARSRLFLCHAGKRQWQGQLRPMAPSPFLRNIEEQLLERSRMEARGRKPRPPHEQLGLFEVT